MNILFSCWDGFEITKEKLKKKILLQIPVGIRDDEQEELLGGNESDEMENSAGTSGESSGNFSSNGGKKSCMARIWRGLDSNFMKPLLTSSRPSLVETLPNFCSPCAHFLTSEDQMGLELPITGYFE